MIVEDEHDTYDDNFDYDHVDKGTPSAEVSHGPYQLILETYMKSKAYMREKQNHRLLQPNFVEHI
jgi:hypothetical protein